MAGVHPSAGVGDRERDAVVRQRCGGDRGSRRGGSLRHQGPRPPRPVPAADRVDTAAGVREEQADLAVVIAHRRDHPTRGRDPLGHRPPGAPTAGLSGGRVDPTDGVREEQVDRADGPHRGDGPACSGRPLRHRQPRRRGRQQRRKRRACGVPVEDVSVLGEPFDRDPVDPLDDVVAYVDDPETAEDAGHLHRPERPGLQHKRAVPLPPGSSVKRVVQRIRVGREADLVVELEPDGRGRQASRVGVRLQGRPRRRNWALPPPAGSSSSSWM